MYFCFCCLQSTRKYSDVKLFSRLAPSLIVDVKLDGGKNPRTEARGNSIRGWKTGPGDLDNLSEFVKQRKFCLVLILLEKKDPFNRKVLSVTPTAQAGKQNYNRSLGFYFFYINIYLFIEVYNTHNAD